MCGAYHLPSTSAGRTLPTIRRHPIPIPRNKCRRNPPPLLLPGTSTTSILSIARALALHTSHTRHRRISIRPINSSAMASDMHTRRLRRREQRYASRRWIRTTSRKRGDGAHGRRRIVRYGCVLVWCFGEGGGFGADARCRHASSWRCGSRGSCER